MLGRISSLAGPLSSAPAKYIVTRGLVAQLEVFRPSSYPGTGTTWTDTVGGYNGTLTNGAAYSSSDGGIIQLDGTNDYVEIADAVALRGAVGAVRTAIIWARVSSYDDNNGLFGKQFGSATYDGYSLAVKTSEGIRLQMNGGAVNGGYNSATGVWSLNTWTMFTAVIAFGGNAKAYVNTTEVINVSNAESSIPSNTAALRIGTDIQDPGDRFPTMDVGAFYFYNRELTATEITQNFNAVRSKYGV